MIKVFGIVYREDQLLDGYERYFNKPNKTTGYLFEYNAMIDILSKDIKEDYLGILSWKFPYKTGIFRKKLENFIKNNPNKDVYILCRPLNVSYMEFSEKQHPGLRFLVKECCKHTGLEYIEDVKNIVYSNFFIAKTEIYKDYIENIIKPSIKILQNELWEYANKDSTYKGLSPEELEEQIGMRYYNMITFTLERLFSQYIQNKKLNICKIY
jgi:hypothetical protein